MDRSINRCGFSKQNLQTERILGLQEIVTCDIFVMDSGSLSTVVISTMPREPGGLILGWSLGSGTCMHICICTSWIHVIMYVCIHTYIICMELQRA